MRFTLELDAFYRKTHPQTPPFTPKQKALIAQRTVSELQADCALVTLCQ